MHLQHCLKYQTHRTFELLEVVCLAINVTVPSWKSSEKVSGALFRQYFEDCICTTLQFKYLNMRNDFLMNHSTQEEQNSMTPHHLNWLCHMITTTAPSQNNALPFDSTAYCSDNSFCFDFILFIVLCFKPVKTRDLVP